MAGIQNGRDQIMRKDLIPKPFQGIVLLISFQASDFSLQVLTKEYFR